MDRPKGARAAVAVIREGQVVVAVIREGQVEVEDTAAGPEVGAGLGVDSSRGVDGSARASKAK